MSIKLSLGALFLFSQFIFSQIFIGQTSSGQTATTTQKFSSPSQAWEFANGPAAQWDADVAAGKTPAAHFKPTNLLWERAKALCPQFALESASGEELYWLAKLCEEGGAFSKALSAAEQYLAFEGGQNRSDARLVLAILQMRTTKDWESSWPTYRIVLKEDPINSDAESAISIALEEEADKNEATALAWSQERYSLLLNRASNPKPETDPVPYVWVFTAGGDLVHRYYLAGQSGKATALVAELNQLKAEHPEGVIGWGADNLSTANMEMNPAPQIPMLKTIGGQPGAGLVQKGRVEVVHFIFLRCSPCITQLKYLDSMQKRFSKENVLVANVTTYKTALQPDEPAHTRVDTALEKMRKKESPHLAMVVAPETTLADYKVTAFPVLAVIDKQGRLRYEGLSNQLDEGEEIDRLVRKLLAE